MAKTNYRNWIPGEIVTAAQLNEQIRDNGNAIWVGTTAGDMDFYSTATTQTRIPIGSVGQVLQVLTGGIPGWATTLSLTNRKGGSSSNWNTPGNTTYAVGETLIQVGSLQFNFSNQTQVNGTANFPIAFSGSPLIFCTIGGATIGSPTTISTAPSTNSALITVSFQSGNPQSLSLNVYWLAIGPK